jgi:hypothetical protein
MDNPVGTDALALCLRLGAALIEDDESPEDDMMDADEWMYGDGEADTLDEPEGPYGMV